MRFGVHVSIAGGFPKAAARAQTLGCEAFQIFAGSPRGWARKELTAAEAEEFKKNVKAAGLGPVVVHLSYLPNPATFDEALYEKSRRGLEDDFDRANRLGADYFVVHPGTCPADQRKKGLTRVARAVQAALGAVAGPTVLLLENQSSRRSDLAADFEEMAALLANLDKRRTGLCLDTCHAFVAGYDLRSDAGWQDLLATIGDRIGLDRLRVIHANDSYGEFGSGLDRHQHIGQGHLGDECFAAMGRRPELRNLPVILETPQKDPGDDPRNLAKIRELARGNQS